MATELEKNGCLEITSIAADWDYRASKPSGWPNKPRLLSIQFDPGATDDKLLVREQDDGGATRFYAICQNGYDQKIKYFHGVRVMPYIDFSGSTLSAGHRVTIELWREK